MGEYDAEGRRVRSLTSNRTVTKDFLYDLGGRIITELSGSGSINRQEVYAGARHLAIYSGASAVYFANSDWLGTERVHTTTSGAVYESFSNLPFGDLLNSVGASPKHFTGKDRDAETGPAHHVDVVPAVAAGHRTLAGGRQALAQEGERGALGRRGVADLDEMRQRARDVEPALPALL